MGYVRFSARGFITEVIGVFFKQAETLPDAMARYEVFIRFLLLGFVIESNNTEAIKDIVRYIKKKNSAEYILTQSSKMA